MLPGVLGTGEVEQTKQMEAMHLLEHNFPRKWLSMATPAVYKTQPQ